MLSITKVAFLSFVRSMGRLRCLLFLVADEGLLDTEDVLQLTHRLTLSASSKEEAGLQVSAPNLRHSPLPSMGKYGSAATC